jgi:hypothetical protein
MELVAHLVRCMEGAGLEIESAVAPGYRKPAHIKAGFMRSKLRPDVVARDGRRTIFGIAVSNADESLREQLDVLAGKCRTIVICIPNDPADQALDMLLQDAGAPHFRKMRVLRHPSTKWQELPRRPRATAQPNPNPSVTVVIEGSYAA